MIQQGRIHLKLVDFPLLVWVQLSKSQTLRLSKKVCEEILERSFFLIFKVIQSDSDMEVPTKKPMTRLLPAKTLWKDASHIEKQNCRKVWATKGPNVNNVQHNQF